MDTYKSEISKKVTFRLSKKNKQSLNIGACRLDF